MGAFDLKSATDLLPAELSFAILRSLFGLDLAHSWFLAMRETMFRDPDFVREGVRKAYRARSASRLLLLLAGVHTYASYAGVVSPFTTKRESLSRVRSIRYLR